MFEAVLTRSTVSRRRLGRGLSLSVLVHLCAVAFVAWVSTRPREGRRAAPEVTFFSPLATGAPGPAPLPLGRPASPDSPRKESTLRRKPDTLYHSKDPYDEAAEADDASDEPIGDPNGDPYGDPSGAPGATRGAGTWTPPPPPPPPPPPQNAAIPFGPGMQRPRKISGPEPQYTREAREARVEGKMLVQCVITVDGRLTSCRILKGLPFMDQPVLSALAQQRWTPVVFQGQPVRVFYTIPIKLVLK